MWISYWLRWLVHFLRVRQPPTKLQSLPNNDFLRWQWPHIRSTRLTLVINRLYHRTNRTAIPTWKSSRNWELQNAKEMHDSALIRASLDYWMLCRLVHFSWLHKWSFLARCTWSNIKLFISGCGWGCKSIIWWRIRKDKKGFGTQT